MVSKTSLWRADSCLMSSFTIPSPKHCTCSQHLLTSPSTLRCLSEQVNSAVSDGDMDGDAFSCLALEWRDNAYMLTKSVLYTHKQRSKRDARGTKREGDGDQTWRIQSRRRALAIESSPVFCRLLYITFKGASNSSWMKYAPGSFSKTSFTFMLHTKTSFSNVYCHELNNQVSQRVELHAGPKQTCDDTRWCRVSSSNNSIVYDPPNRCCCMQPDDIMQGPLVCTRSQLNCLSA